MFLDNLETLYLNSEPLYLTPPVLTLEGIDRTLQVQTTTRAQHPLCIMIMH